VCLRGLIFAPHVRMCCGVQKTSLKVWLQSHHTTRLDFGLHSALMTPADILIMDFLMCGMAPYFQELTWTA